MKLELLNRLLLSSLVLLGLSFCAPAWAIISESSWGYCVGGGGGTGYAYLQTSTLNTSTTDYLTYFTMGTMAEAWGPDAEGTSNWGDVILTPGTHQEGWSFDFYSAIPGAYVVHGQHRYTFIGVISFFYLPETVYGCTVA
jgi:hypothetical protein